MKNYLILATFMAAFVALPAFATTTGTPQPFSKYGQIQNVQNYSSNPFWNPNGPYNQRMPQAVYATGADLTTADCQRTVSNLINAECALKNNCRGMRVSDIRPTIMTQLSRLPGHNYATSCSGYIDTIFNDYVKNNSVANGTGVITLPTATTPNPSAHNNNNQFKIENPYKMQMPQWNGDNWFQGIIDRDQELKQLEAQTDPQNNKLVKADFPTTAADLSFTERMDNLREGYKPYAGKSGYQQIHIESIEDYAKRMQELNNLTNTDTAATDSKRHVKVILKGLLGNK